MNIGDIIKDGTKKFIVIKIYKNTVKLRQVYIKTYKSGKVNIRMGDFFTAEKK